MVLSVTGLAFTSGLTQIVLVMIGLDLCIDCFCHALYLPETKGLSVEEIIQTFEEQTQSGSPSAASG
jgi:hypothetical protein